jgi:hypothetical protein
VRLSSEWNDGDSPLSDFGPGGTIPNPPDEPAIRGIAKLEACDTKSSQ